MMAILMYCIYAQCTVHIYFDQQRKMYVSKAFHSVLISLLGNSIFLSRYSGCGAWMWILCIEYIIESERMAYEIVDAKWNKYRQRNLQFIGRTRRLISWTFLLSTRITLCNLFWWKCMHKRTLNSVRIKAVNKKRYIFIGRPTR